MSLYDIPTPEELLTKHKYCFIFLLLLINKIVLTNKIKLYQSFFITSAYDERNLLNHILLRKIVLSSFLLIQNVIMVLEGIRYMIVCI